MTYEPCTYATPCAACKAGLAKESSRRPEYGAGSVEPPAMRRRFGPWDDALCRVSILPRNACAGCQRGHHYGEAPRMALT
jgi:hypothetical protein